MHKGNPLKGLLIHGAASFRQKGKRFQLHSHQNDIQAWQEALP